MFKADSIKIKINITLISLCLVGSCIFLYFLDDSQEWNSVKIISLIIVNVWIFFTPATFRYLYMLNKDKKLNDWFYGRRMRTGLILLPILIAPFLGMKYYISTNCYK